MADYRAEARRAATRAGIDPNMFVRQIQQESHFDPTARSKYAVGIAQITPDTARAWGVNPTDPIASLNAAARNMASYVRKYGGIENALRAYNAGPGAIQASKRYPETNNYVKTILGGRTPRPTTPRASTPRAAPSAPGSDGSDSLLAALGAMQPQGTQGALTPVRPRVQVTAPTAPSFSARPVAPAAAQTPTLAAPGTEPEAAEQAAPRSLNIGAALEAIQALSPTASPRAPARGGASPGGAAPARGGKIAISGPNPGRLKPGVTSFAKQVAGVLGAKMILTDGSTHSKYTTTGNVSEHYSGNATDIFTVNGKNLKQNQGLLLQAGRAALIAAGMPRAQARKAPFGLYNVGNHQIIFGTNSRALGGDHTDHLHISTHAR